MRTNRTNQKHIVEYNKIYMSFAIEPGYQDDIMESVWNYASEVCAKGTDFIKKNLMTCKTANSCRVFWDCEPAEPGDWYCKFCCGCKNSDIAVNAFVNSRLVEDGGNGPQEVYFVRLSVSATGTVAKTDWWKGRTGILSNYVQAQDFDDLWESIAGIDEPLYMKQSA